MLVPLMLLLLLVLFCTTLSIVDYAINENAETVPYWLYKRHCAIAGWNNTIVNYYHDYSTAPRIPLHPSRSSVIGLWCVMMICDHRCSLRSLIAVLIDVSRGSRGVLGRLLEAF